MEKTEILDRLGGFKTRLMSDVVPAYTSRGSEFGRERFSAWRRQLIKFLDEALPGQSNKLNAKLHHRVMVIGRSETDLDVFMRMDGKACLAFIDSLLQDIQNDEFEPVQPAEKLPPLPSVPRSAKPSTKVFIVHGHDELLKTKAARFIERLGLEPVILHEQANKGMTIIEKIEAHTEVGFAIVLYTPDDKGNVASEADTGLLNSRARQNVVFEHGYLMAKLDRARVVTLMSGSLETPSDISGVVYVDDSNWQIDIAKEMNRPGF